MQTREVFVARPSFWKKDGLAPHMNIGLSHFYHAREMAEEVPGERSILIGSFAPGTTEKQVLAASRSRHPGKSDRRCRHRQRTAFSENHRPLDYRVWTKQRAFFLTMCG